MEDVFVYNNEEESEMGQVHAIHLNMNAVGKIRADLEKQRMYGSRCNCEECGDEIPEERRKSVPGVTLCVHCKEVEERGNNVSR